MRSLEIIFLSKDFSPFNLLNTKRKSEIVFKSASVASFSSVVTFHIEKICRDVFRLKYYFLANDTRLRAKIFTTDLLCSQLKKVQNHPLIFCNYREIEGTKLKICRDI